MGIVILESELRVWLLQQLYLIDFDFKTNLNLIKCLLNLKMLGYSATIVCEVPSTRPARKKKKIPMWKFFTSKVPVKSRCMDAETV